MSLSVKAPPEFKQKNFAYSIFLLLGLAVLFPFNAFLKAGSFLADQLEGTSVTNNPQLYVIAAFTISNSVFVIALNLLRLDTMVSFS